MEKQYEKKIIWTIKNFPSLPSTRISSDQFVVRGCKWRLMAYPKGDYNDNNNNNNNFSLFLEVPDSETLPSGWRRRTKFCLTVVHQHSEELSQQKESQNSLFDQKNFALGYGAMLPLTKLLDRNGGFLVNNEVKIAAEVGVLEAVGKSDVLEETSLVMETMDVNGFEVFPAQVESVKSLFEKHPDIASNFRPNNPQLRTTCLNVLLSLSEILCKSSEKLSNDDLADAYSALRYVTKAGFKLDWLEKNLKEAGETRRQEIEEESKNLKWKYADRDALLEFLG